VRTALRTAVLATLLAAALPATCADATGSPPTPAQIRAAVRAALRSSSLWATINICDTRRYPNTVGIRGQMPTLGFTSSLSMDVQVEFRSAANRRFRPISGVERTLRLGRAASALHQGGANFRFSPHAGTFSATITFEWKLAGKVLGRATRRTTVGHPQADFGDPAHFSAALCQIR
jgi:hypothetical protein